MSLVAKLAAIYLKLTRVNDKNYQKEIKKIVKNAEDVFHLWKGISGHPHPSTDQHSSQPDAGFPVPGANNIAQHNEDIKAAEEKPRTVE